MTKLNKLILKNFRNYDNLEIDFNDTLNIIIGNNAQGKTNILESIYFLSITKSFLSINDKNVIKNGEKFSLIKANISDNNRTDNLSIILNSQRKQIFVNDNEIKKFSDYIGLFKVIIFSPDSVRILKDGPSSRRRFLNIEISQLYNKYINILNEFNIVLKQRNEYLKIIRNSSNNENYFSILNDKFISLAILIYNYRNEFINKINEHLGKIFSMISGEEGLYIKYITNIKITDIDVMKDQFLEKLKINYNKEILHGTTLIGPHRDDFSFYLGEKNLSLFGSQGQIKMAILSLKLAEINTFYDISKSRPILLLDDLFSELDVDKRNKVIKYLNMDIQTILTTTDLDNIDRELVKYAFVYEIKEGTVIYKNYYN